MKLKNEISLVLKLRCQMFDRNVKEEAKTFSMKYKNALLRFS